MLFSRLHFPFICHVVFVADDNDYNAGLSVFLYLFLPVGDLIKGLLISQVIDKNDSIRLLVEALRQVPESLLTSRVPDFYAHCAAVR